MLDRPLTEEEAEEFTARDAEEYTRVMATELEKRDLLLQQVGHEWTGESIGIPTMVWKEISYILTDKQRSMLAQLNGKRDFFYGVSMNTNLCYTSPTAIDATSGSIADYVEEHRCLTKNRKGKM